MRPISVLLLLCASVLLQPAGGQETDTATRLAQEARSLFDAQQFPVAKGRAEAAAQAGSTDAMVILGRIYLNGSGVPKETAEAMRWFQKAADAGNAEGMRWLGTIWSSGNGVTRDEKLAVEWFRKSANAGNARAKFDLGVMYDNGRGVDRDFEEALHLYRDSAGAGYPPAMASTGHMYEVAAGTPKSYIEASRWYRAAAVAGDSRGMYYLGALFDSGHAASESGATEVRDPAQAFSWFEKAAKAGNVQAMNRLTMAYEKGTGVAADLSAATDWARNAAARNSPDAIAWLKLHDVQPPTPPQPPAGIHRVGGGVSAPFVIFRIDPEYSELARKLRAVGTVSLAVVVDSDGQARNIQVLRPLGFGLDEKAIESVQKWRFKPGERAGEAVSVRATIEVNFRLLSKPDDHLWYSGPIVFAAQGVSVLPVLREGEIPGPQRNIANESVVLGFTVDSSGGTRNIQVLHGTSSSAEPLLRSLAKWKFHPATNAGEFVESKGRVRFVTGAGDDAAKTPLSPP